MGRKNTRYPTESPGPRTRGAPYAATTRRGDTRASGRESTPGPAFSEDAPERYGTLSPVIEDAGRLASGEPPPSPPQAPPSPPKVTFGGARSPARTSAVAALVTAVAIVAAAAAAVAAGRILSGRAPQRSDSVSPEEVAPPPVIEGGPTESPSFEEKRIPLGRFVVIVPDGWTVVSQTASRLELQNQSGEARMTLVAGSGVSHSQLAPSCQATPTPTATMSPTPGSPTRRTVEAPSTSKVLLADSPAELKEGTLDCPIGSGPTEYATVVTSDASFGIGFLGDTTSFRLLLPGLVVPQ